MDPAHFLASLTGFPNPGRFCIKTKGPSDGVRTDAQRDHQAQLIHEYLCQLYTCACDEIAGAYNSILDADEAWLSQHDEVCDFVFSRIKNCCYPYVSVPEKSIFAIMAEPALSGQAYAIRMPTIDHAITIADPKISESYLLREISGLLAEGYTVEAGLSVVPIPVFFALENRGVGDQPKPGKRTDAVQWFFPMPNLAEIEDSLVDGTYKRRNSVNFINNDYQLFYSRFWHKYKVYLSSDQGHKDHWRKLQASPIRATYEKFKERLEVDSLFTGLLCRVTGEPKSVRLPLRFPKRLGYFDALRCDYSYARIRHYTHTSPEYFQPYILFTNYPKYVRRFVLRAIAEVHTAPKEQPSRLILPSKNRDRGSRGELVDRAKVTQIFSSEQLDRIVRMTSSALEVTDSPESIKEIECIVDERFVPSDGQLPAYHFFPSQVDGARPRRDLARPQYRKVVFEDGPLPGITLINIGVGPSNARTITDHLAVLRPLCWMMVGHCGGLRHRQHLGDYVIANGYVRRDGILDDEVPLDAPIHAQRVVNLALFEATAHREDRDLLTAAYRDALPDDQVSSKQWLPQMSQESAEGDAEIQERQIRMLHSIRSKIRTGPVISVSNRNWETSPTEDIFELFERYRVVAVDMESATLAANGFRYRIPHGTFLCVSDKPLHGAIKMRLFADEFYKSQIDQHLDIAMDAIKWLAIDLDSATDLLNARELRGMDDPPWR
jgi:nucleoside phosphorylase